MKTPRSFSFGVTKHFSLQYNFWLTKKKFEFVYKDKIHNEANKFIYSVSHYHQENKKMKRRRYESITEKHPTQTKHVGFQTVYFLFEWHWFEIMNAVFIKIILHNISTSNIWFCYAKIRTLVCLLNVPSY